MVEIEFIHPLNYPRSVPLLDGRKACIRPVCHADRREILRFFYRLSPDTRFRRYQYAKPLLTDKELDHYCNADHYNVFVLVAEMERHGCIDLVGIGEYERLPREDGAEVAFVVEDDEQCNGIGTHLLNELGIVARERAITTFLAELLRQNRVMLDIFRKYAPEMKQVVNGGSIHVSVPVRLL